MKKYYVYNDWELSKCYWTYDYDSAVAAANRMVEGWKRKNRKYFDDFQVEVDILGKNECNPENVHVWITDRQDFPFWRNIRNVIEL